jgi:acetoin utilization deacetylase AcuC-like enzyme
MIVFYTDQYVLPLPDGHTFPMQKYRLLREQVVASGLVAPADLRVPHAATPTELLLAHEPDYVHRAIYGLLTDAEMRRIGFPWSAELIERSRRSSGATVEAAFAALDAGYAINLAGGTHHAFADHGEGYCVFNDSIIAARAVQSAGRCRRVVVIDLDVHQGNGTAAIARGDDSIYTFSVHGAKNYPWRKEQSDLDLELPDGTADQAYLDAVQAGLAQALPASRADLALFLAGSDPYQGDRLGRLSVSSAGLAERDRLVVEACQAAGLPLVLTMAGGYARDVRDTVALHWQTIERVLRQQAAAPAQKPSAE